MWGRVEEGGDGNKWGGQGGGGGVYSHVCSLTSLRRTSVFQRFDQMKNNAHKPDLQSPL